MRLIPLYCHLIFNMIMLILPPATCLHFPAVVCQSVFYHFKVSDDVSLLLLVSVLGRRTIRRKKKKCVILLFVLQLMSSMSSCSTNSFKKCVFIISDEKTTCVFITRLKIDSSLFGQTPNRHKDAVGCQGRHFFLSQTSSPHLTSACDEFTQQGQG